MKGILWSWLLAFSLVAGVLAYAGDEDPFPLACVDFSGNWRTDDGLQYGIKQKGCRQLTLSWKENSANHKTLIVADDKERPISGPDYKGQARTRWNSKRYGTTIETTRTMDYEGGKVYEVVQIERVNSELMLQSTYRVINNLGQDPFTSYEQKVFRKMSSNRQR